MDIFLYNNPIAGAYSMAHRFYAQHNRYYGSSGDLIAYGFHFSRIKGGYAGSPQKHYIRLYAGNIRRISNYSVPDLPEIYSS